LALPSGRISSTGRDANPQPSVASYLGWLSGEPTPGTIETVAPSCVRIKPTRRDLVGAGRPRCQRRDNVVSAMGDVSYPPRMKVGARCIFGRER
jgi:hypothetical protein